MWEIWVALPGKGNSSCKSSSTHSYQHLQYFPVSKQLYGCGCFRFLTCAQMFMHVTAHGACMDTVRESALKVDPGREKYLAVWGTWTCVRLAPGFSVGCSTNWAIPSFQCRWVSWKDVHLTATSILPITACTSKLQYVSKVRYHTLLLPNFFLFHLFVVLACAAWTQLVQGKVYSIRIFVCMCGVLPLVGKQHHILTLQKQQGLLS